MDDIEKILREAEKLMNSGKSKQFHSLLTELVEQKIPEALHLSALYGKKDEKAEVYFQRNLWLINQAASLNYAPSLYDLGVRHDTGVDLVKSGIIAAVYFEKAADLGHSRAKLFHGMNLVQGINRIPKDKERGLDYIRQAAAEKAEDAAKILDQILAGEWD
jgi:TPR repeat protein